MKKNEIQANTPSYEIAKESKIIIKKGKGEPKKKYKIVAELYGRYYATQFNKNPEKRKMELINQYGKNIKFI